MKIVLIGAGNIAWHFGMGFHKTGIRISQVFNRTITHAKELASQLDCNATDQINGIDPGADLYLLAVHDDAIGPLAGLLRDQLPKNACIVHSSGATPQSVFDGRFVRHGVLWPVMTLHKTHMVDLAEVPLMVSASDQQTQLFLEKMALKISHHVYPVSDAVRRVVHLAATVANNFSNHFYAVAASMLEKEEVKFDVLRPIILETAKRVQTHMPGAMQTGPAVRGDISTIHAHLALLRNEGETQRLYRLISKHINPDLPLDQNSL